MGNLFGSEKPLKDVIRENQRMLKKAVRELEKEIASLKKNETKLTQDIKKMAKQNQMGAVRVMAKDLVRTRNYITRFIEMKTHLNAVSLKLQTVKSQQSMSDAMKGVTKALVLMNKKMNLPGLQKVMKEFMKENERAEFMQEALGDTIDDAMAEEGSAEEEDKVVNQVLDELGVATSDELAEAPGSKPNVAAAEAEAKPDTGMTELEERLNNLRR